MLCGCVLAPQFLDDDDEWCNILEPQRNYFAREVQLLSIEFQAV